MSDDDDLFKDSSDEGDTDDLLKQAKEKPVVKKRLQKKSASSPKKKIPDADADDDDDDDLFGDGGGDKSSMSKRERMEALQAKKRQEQQGSQPARASSSGGAPDKTEKGYDSADTYDSAQYVRTKEDNDFIDTEGDDQDAINELYAEQHFHDERPIDEDDDDEISSRRKKKKAAALAAAKRKRGPDALSDTEEGDDNPIMAAVNKMKRKKKVARKPTELEDDARNFVSQMTHAAEQDAQAVKARRPALAKLAMLEQVTEMLTKRDMIRHLINVDVLNACKLWIQPLQPSGALGNVTVRHRILEAITYMSQGEDGINSTDLKQSGIGQTVMILYKHKSETPNLKRMLKKLIEQWSRPIFAKSGNMKDLEVAQTQRQTRIPSARQQIQHQSHQQSQKKNLSSLIAGKNSREASGGSRVRVPYSKGFQFTVRPQSRTTSEEIKESRKAANSASGGNRGQLSKRMIEKGRAASKNSRSANLSVEGRPVK